jgi:hypothetical protein
MSQVQWAADLLRELKSLRTGHAKLDALGRAMVEHRNDPDLAHLPADHPDRHMTAAEALDVLRKHPTVGEVTIDKARQLVEKGRYTPPAGASKPVDLLPLPPSGQAPVRKAKKAKVVAPEPTAIAGVQSLAIADVDTLGVKPVEPSALPKKSAAKKAATKKGKKAEAKEPSPAEPVVEDPPAENTEPESPSEPTEAAAESDGE